MSRTDKDRPYWVKTADPTLAREAVHRHELLGKKPRYRFYPWEDKPDVTLVETTSSDYVFNELLLEKDDVNWLDALLTPEDYQQYVTVVSSVKTEEIITTVLKAKRYPDECELTVEPVAHKSEYREHACYYNLRQRYHYLPDKDERKNFHHGVRSKETSGLKNTVKEMNGSHFQDYNEERITTARSLHTRWW